MLPSRRTRSTLVAALVAGSAIVLPAIVVPPTAQAAPLGIAAAVPAVCPGPPADLPAAVWGAPLPAGGLVSLDAGETACFAFTAPADGGYFVRSAQPSRPSGSYQQVETDVLDPEGDSRWGSAAAGSELTSVHLTEDVAYTITVTNPSATTTSATVGVFRAADDTGCVPHSGDTSWPAPAVTDVTLASAGEVSCHVFVVPENSDDPTAQSNWQLLSDAPGGLGGWGETGSSGYSTSQAGRLSMWRRWDGTGACGASSSVGLVSGACDLRAGEDYRIYTFDERGHADETTPVPATTHLWIRRIADDPGCLTGIDDTVTLGSPLLAGTLAAEPLGVLQHDQYDGRRCHLSRLEQGSRVRVDVPEGSDLAWWLVDADGMSQSGHWEGTTRRYCDGEQGCLLSGPPPYRLLVEGQAGADYAIGLRRISEPGGCTTIDGIAETLPAQQGVLDDADAERCFRVKVGDGDRLRLRAHAPGDEETGHEVAVHRIDGTRVSPDDAGPEGSTYTFDVGTQPAAGTHTIVVRSGDGGPGPFELTGECLTVPCGPFAVTSVPTDEVGADPVTLRVEGTGLTEHATVRLVQGEEQIDGEVRARGTDGRSLDVRVDLTGRSGSWDVEAASGTKTSGLADAVSISETTWPAALRTTLTGPSDGLGASVFVPGRTHRVTVTVENTGDFDATAAPVFLYGLPPGSTVAPLFDMTRLDEAGDFVPYDLADAPFTYDDGELAGAAFFISRLGPGAVEELDFAVTTPLDSPDHVLRSASGACNLDVEAAGLGGGGGGGQSVGITRRLAAAVPAGCYAAIGDMLSFLIPGADCVDLVSGVIDGMAEDLSRLTSADGSWLPTEASVMNRALDINLDGTGCVADIAAKPLKVIGALIDVLAKAQDASGLPEDVQNAIRICFPEEPEPGEPGEEGNPFAVPPEDYRPLQGGWTLPRISVASIDPNEVVGPAGAGPDRAFRGEGRHRYRVYFENDPDATAPAQEVRITSQLDPDVYDLSTLRFGRVAFGATTWSAPPGSTALDERIEVADAALEVGVTAGVTPAGELTWHLGALDPVTLTVPPEDPLLGFLPPNDDGVEGQGYVDYSVALRDVPTGTVVSNQAEIVFDLNEPIVTNTWTNLVDLDAPTAQVVAPSEATGPFEVTWTADDPTSGVARIDVYVAVDGGPYTLWQDGVAPGTATYPGEPGHTYSFGALAWDWTMHRSIAADPPGPTTTVTTGDGGNPPGPPVPPIPPIPPGPGPVLSCAGRTLDQWRAAGYQVIVGTAGPDRLTGTGDSDVIVGLGGNDRIKALAGRDVVCGGDGKDRIVGGAGKDRLLGEGGSDRIRSRDAGRDVVVGGGGKDRVVADRRDRVRSAERVRR